MLESNFGVLDWVIVTAYLLGTVAIGLYVNRYIRDMTDFIVAGRSLRSRLGIATMIGSELGLVTVMYSAEKGFTGGFAAFHIGLAAGIVTLVVGFTGFIVVPLRELKVMTIPEFYERRFSRGVRIFGGILLATGGILNMGMFLKAGATFVAALTGIADPFAVNMIMTVLIVLVLVYTTLGGMVSVVITDYLQFVVLSIGLILTCVFAVASLGWSNIVDTVREVHGEGGFDPLSEEGFGWKYVVWMGFLGVVSCAVWQTAVLRACAAESTRVVKQLYVWSSIGFAVRSMLPQFLGICALVYFWNHAEARGLFFEGTGTLLKDSEQTLKAMPTFLGQILPAGLIGLIGAGMLAAFMSTHDTYLLCWATSIAEDVIHPATGYRLSTRARLLTTRVFIVIIAAFLLVWSLWYKLGQDLWDYMTVTGGIYFTGAFAVLGLGLYWKRASTVGAYLALSAGWFMLLGLKPVQDALEYALKGALLRMGAARTELEINWDSEAVGLTTVAAAVLLMIAGSLAFPDRGSESADGERGS